MDDHTALIASEGGAWAETEILGDRALVKVRANPSTLTMLNSIPGYIRLPKDGMDDSLSDLSSVQKQAVRDLIIDCGYSPSEFGDRFPADLGSYTLGDVMRFMATRRRRPRYDSSLDAIVLDGAIQSCRDVGGVDTEVI
jgi:hypothetical protein